MSKRRKKRKSKPPPRFKVGDRVWVRHGVRDVEHPDIPMGGWAGTVAGVHRDGVYTIRWSRETLASIHPICKKRCAIDGAALEEYWLSEEDLEPDPGEPLSIEQPAEIRPRPLSPKEQGDRVRMVFGLTSDDFLPGVDEDTLETYYDFLEERLSVPFEAQFADWEPYYRGPEGRRVEVVGLDREVGWTDEGILCKAVTADGEHVVPLRKLELRRSAPNHQFVDDFVAWFIGELCEDSGYEDEESFDEELDEEGAAETAGPLRPRSVPLLVLEFIAFTASYGAVMGAALAVMPWARWAAGVGGALLGLLVAADHVKAGKSMLPGKPWLRKTVAGTIGVTTGTVAGAFFGVAVIAFVGAILGAVVAALLLRAIGDVKGQPFRVFPGSPVVGAACGIAAQAYYLNHVRAAQGFFYGTLAGLGAGLFFCCLVALPLTYFIVRIRRAGWERRTGLSGLWPRTNSIRPPHPPSRSASAGSRRSRGSGGSGAG